MARLKHSCFFIIQNIIFLEFEQYVNSKQYNNINACFQAWECMWNISFLAWKQAGTCGKTSNWEKNVWIIRSFQKKSQFMWVTWLVWTILDVLIFSKQCSLFRVLQQILSPPIECSTVLKYRHTDKSCYFWWHWDALPTSMKSMYWSRIVQTVLKDVCSHNDGKNELGGK